MRGYAPVGPAPGEPSPTFAQRRRKPITIFLLAAVPAVVLLAWIGRDRLPAWSESFDTIKGGGDGWEYVDQVDGERALRRLSWGALERQGAAASIRTNLKNDKAYLFTLYGAGWNNQVIQMMNLIYLAHLSDRIPIIPSFRWNMWPASTDVAVGEIFDLSQVSSSLNDMPLVELHEVKGSTTRPERLMSVVYDGETEQYGKDGAALAVGDRIHAEPLGDDSVGCWSMRESSGEVPRQDGEVLYKISTPYTPFPRSVFNWNEDPGRPSFRRVAKILRERQQQEPLNGSLAILSNYSIPHPSAWPDTHLACVDTVFGFGEQIDHYDVGGEYRSGTGAWAAVGGRMRFSRGVERIGEMYLREIFGGDVAPYLAVHIRRTDFGDAFLALTQRQYAHAAWTVKESLRIKHGIDIKHVLATSDETDLKWLSVLQDYGFTFVNHTQLNTVERFGPWFPTVLDSYLLSSGRGFLGVIYSTMSILAYRRTIDWNQGVARMIELDHQVPPDWKWT